MLDVQKVRLRFIFVRALYPASLFPKGLRRSMLYDMLLLKIVLNVYPIRLRFISARLLASVASIFKSAGCKGISFVAAKKLILNVSERPRTGGGDVRGSTQQRVCFANT